ADSADSEAVEGVGGRDQVARGGVGIVTLVARGGAADHALVGGDVHADGGDGGAAVEIRLGIPVDVAQRTGDDVPAALLDELEAGNVEVLLLLILIGGVLGAAEDVARLCRGPDVVAGRIRGERAQNERAVIVNTGRIARLSVHDRIV